MELLTSVEEITFVVQLILAGALGAALGWERQTLDKPAGLRTYMMVTMGAALFTIISRLGFTGIVDIGLDPSRVASSIVTGIGFIGGGVILYEKNHVRGLTTAAGMWFAAAVGMAVGVQFYLLSVVATVLALIVLRFLLSFEHVREARMHTEQNPYGPKKKRSGDVD